MLVHADISAVQDRYSAERGVPRYVSEFAVEAAHRAPDLIDTWMLRRGRPVPPGALSLMSLAQARYRDTVGAPDVVHHLAPFHDAGSGLTAGDLLDRRHADARVAVTIYDLIPMIYPQVYLRDPRFRDDYRLVTSFVQNADLVMTISDSAARDVVDLLGVPASRVVSVGTGVPAEFEPSSDPAATFAQVRTHFPQLRPGFLLYVGGIDFRKNMTGTLEAYARLDRATRRAHQLVLVCRLVGDSGRQLRRRLAELGIARDVVLTGLVDDGTLTMLYQTTDLFIFPSLYEGFGLPVIEALRSGAPVVVGDNSSLRDIVPVPEARFDSTDPDSIAGCITTTLANEQSRTRTLREVDHSRHTWPAVVDATRDAYRLLERSRTPRSSRIAFVTPLPPAATGIAIYNERLLRELARITPIDVFSQPEADLLAIPGVRQFPYGAYDGMRGRERYLDTVLAMGNSFFHLNEFEILRKHGGSVMLHDARVSGLLYNVRALRQDLLTAQEKDDLARIDEEELPRALGDYPAYDPARALQANGLMSSSITAWADKVFMHSNAARGIARLEAQPGRVAELGTLPLAFVEPHGHRRADADAVTSFGYLHATKQSDVLCEAFVIAARSLPDTTFAFVGQLGDTVLRAKLEKLISDAHLEDRIVITDWQTPEQYSEWIARSIVTVQPRVQFNGEASAAVTESLGAGIPTIVSDLGWMAELPDDIVVKLPVAVTPDHLAQTIVDLVRDPARMSRMSEAADAYAKEHTFAAVAAALYREISGAPAARTRAT